MGAACRGALRVACWGCGRRLAVPEAPGRAGAPAERFRCGWCGAISSLTAHEARVEVVPQLVPPRGCGAGGPRARRRRWGERVLVVAVAGLVSCLALGGFRLLDGLDGFGQAGRFGAGAVLAVLISNVCFNYACAALRSAGETAHLRAPLAPPGPGVAMGALEGYRFCTPCGAPKPPHDHHCKICGTCVVEMDHHCPFIANCVGRQNLRHFLLFLLYACLGLAEVTVVAALAFLQAAPTPTSEAAYAAKVRAGSPLPPLPTGGVGLPGAGGLILRAASAASKGGPRAAAAALMAVLSGALGLALAVLLAAQVRLVIAGATTIDRRQGTSGRSEASAWTGLQRVFGTGHPLTWVFPAVAPPRGSASVENGAKDV